MNDVCTMVDDVAAGRAAWERLQERARKSWDDWKAVGVALQIGRALALEEAGIDVPYGKRYTKAMGRWLAENGLDAIGQQLRHRVLSCMDNLAEIEQWRASLDAEARNRLNHPDAVFWRWHRRDIMPMKGTRSSRQTHKPGRATSPAGPFRRVSRPTGELIRLVAMALVRANSRDRFIEAEHVLTALADAGVIDFNQEPRRPMPAIAAAVHAPA
jgi:hypothetical protein